jgi:phospholipase/carboxylesterase
MAPAPLDFVHEYTPGGLGRGGAPFAGITLLLLHGTGGNEHDLIPLGRAVAPGAALLSPRGRVLEGAAPRFFRRLAEGVFDVPDLLERTDELAAFVKGAGETYNFGTKRVVALGFSNGANIAASLLLRHPRLLAGAALLRAMVPYELTAPVHIPGTPVYVSGGKSDPLVPPENTARLAALLDEAGAQVTVKWQPTGHQLATGEVAQLRDWLVASNLR